MLGAIQRHTAVNINWKPFCLLSALFFSFRLSSSILWQKSEVERRMLVVGEYCCYLCIVRVTSMRCVSYLIAVNPWSVQTNKWHENVYPIHWERSRAPNDRKYRTKLNPERSSKRNGDETKHKVNEENCISDEKDAPKAIRWRCVYANIVEWNRVLLLLLSWLTMSWVQIPSSRFSSVSFSHPFHSPIYGSNPDLFRLSPNSFCVQLCMSDVNLVLLLTPLRLTFHFAEYSVMPYAYAYRHVVCAYAMCTLTVSSIIRHTFSRLMVWLFTIWKIVNRLSIGLSRARFRNVRKKNFWIDDGMRSEKFAIRILRL